MIFPASFFSFILSAFLKNRVALHSITFIKLVIEFENVFNVEFDDDKLDYENFKTLDEVCNYIRSLLQENK